MARKSFIIYNSWEAGINKLSPEEQVLFLKRLFEAHNGRKLTPIPAEMIRLDMFWDAIEFNINANVEKYEAQVERVSKARKSNPKVRNNDSLSKKSNVNVNANVNVNEEVNVNADVKVDEEVKYKVKVNSKEEVKEDTMVQFDRIFE